MNELNDLLRQRVEALDKELQATRVKLLTKDRELTRTINALNTLKNERSTYQWN